MEKLKPAFQVVIRIVDSTWQRLRDADVALLAGSLSFATVMSIVPLLAVSLSVFSAFGGFESLLNKIEPFLLQNLVSASGVELTSYMRQAIQRVHSGALGATGLIGLLFTSTKLFHDMETAVQRVWRLKAKHSLLQRLLVYWVVMFLGPVVLAIALGVLTSRYFGVIHYLPRGTLTLIIEFIALALLYKLVPACKVDWASGLVSALVASLALQVVHNSYANLTTHILRYSRLYGSLASVPIFLLWVLVLWWIFLVGVAMTAAIQDQRINSSPTESEPSAS